MATAILFSITRHEEPADRPLESTRQVATAPRADTVLAPVVTSRSSIEAALPHQAASRGFGQIELSSLDSSLDRTAPVIECRLIAGEPASGKTRGLRVGQPSSLPQGQWRLVPLVEGLWVSAREVEIVAQESVSLWCGLDGTREFRVEDAAGQPVSGAELRWTAAVPDGLSLDLPDHQLAATTDATGTVTFSGIGLWRGTAEVGAAGFAPLSTRVASSDAQPTVLTLAAQPSTVDRQVLVVDLETAMPVEGAAVRVDGVDWGTTDREGKWDVPAWCADDALLEIVRDGIAASYVAPSGTDPQLTCRLPQGLPGTLLIPSTVQLPIRLDVTAVLDLGPHSNPRMVYLRSRIEDTPAGREIPAKLPAGVRCSLSATLMNGAAGQARATITESGWTVNLPLDHSPAVILDVLDLDGTPVCDAQVEITLTPEDEPLRLKAKPSGLELFSVDHIHSIRITAPGFESAVIRPYSGPMSGGGRVRVGLRRSTALVGRVVDQDGQPVVGVSLSVRPTPSASWHAENENNGTPGLAHHEWSRDRSPAIKSVSSNSGAIEFQAPAGHYEIYRSRNNWAGAEAVVEAPLGVSHPSADPFEYVVASEAEVILRIRDQSGRVPTEAFLLREDGFWFATARGGQWTASLPVTTRKLYVVAPSMGIARVDLSLGKSGERIDVVLEEADRMVVKLDSKRLDTAGYEVEFSVVGSRPTGEGGQLFNGTCQLNSRGEVVIHAPPMATHLQLYWPSGFDGVDYDQAGARWDFTPGSTATFNRPASRKLGGR